MSLSTLNMSAVEKYIETAVQKSVKLAEENPVAVGLGAAGAFVSMLLVYRKASLKRDGQDYDNQLTGAVRILNNTDHTLKTDEFQKSIADYHTMFGGARSNVGEITTDASVELRRKRYDDMVNHFYNLVTDFYEWGWGQSFHFAPRFHNETFVESIKRCEYFLAAQLGLKKGMTALDVGCGVGGPMRNIAVFTGAKIEGITINEYQVKVGNKYNAMHGLDSICHLNQGDFQELPWNANTFDVAYEIEATCHSPDRVKTFSGIARVLKPGGLFAGYEWCTTDSYDPNNKDHVRIKEGIEVGNSLPTIVHYSKVIEAMEAAGFEVLDHFDANAGQHHPNQIPWYDTLNGKMTLSGFRMTHIGRICTHTMVWILETLRIAPKGTTEVSALLNATAIDLVDSGKLSIFTPSYFFIGRKK